MKDYIKSILAIIGLVIVLCMIIVSIIWSIAQYKECKRITNFTTFYCVQHAL